MIFNVISAHLYASKRQVHEFLMTGVGYNSSGTQHLGRVLRCRKHEGSHKACYHIFLSE